MVCSFKYISRFKKRLTVILLAITVLTSCSEKREQPPVPEEVMESVLLDLHLAESYSQGLGKDVKDHFEKNYDSLSGFYTSILKHYNLPFAEFNDALDWYKKRPERLDSLYQNIINLFNELKSKEGIRDLEEKSDADKPMQPLPLKPKENDRDSTDIPQVDVQK